MSAEEGFTEVLAEFTKTLGYHAGNMAEISQKCQAQIASRGGELTRSQLNSFQNLVNELSRCGHAAKQLHSLLGEYRAMVDGVYAGLKEFAEGGEDE